MLQELIYRLTDVLTVDRKKTKEAKAPLTVGAPVFETMAVNAWTFFWDGHGGTALG